MRYISLSLLLLTMATFSLSACRDGGQAEGTPSGPPCGKCDGWGFDDRHEIYEQPKELVDRYARAVGAMVDQYALNFADDGSASMNWSVRSLGAEYRLCDDQRFFDQPTLSHCTGFWVGGDIFVTAGHCVGGCESTRVLFDYAYHEKPNDPLTPFSRFPAEDIYRCDEVLLRVLDDQYDIAVLRLDRPVTGRRPLSIRREGEIVSGEPVFMIGHPSGLPMKIAANGSVQDSHLTGLAEPRWDNSKEHFYIDIESFPGNSGGPVYNERTGLVEGVLVTNSANDWVFDSERRCRVMGVCGVNVDCAHYAGVQPITAYAAQITEWVEHSPGATPDAGSPGHDIGRSAADAGRPGMDADSRVVDSGWASMDMGWGVTDAGIIDLR